MFPHVLGRDNTLEDRRQVLRRARLGLHHRASRCLIQRTHGASSAASAKGLRQHYGDDWATREIGGVNIKERFEYEYRSSATRALPPTSCRCRVRAMGPRTTASASAPAVARLPALSSPTP